MYTRSITYYSSKSQIHPESYINCAMRDKFIDVLKTDRKT
jgi:hypothetical protein